jgi:hypothetical protein
LVVEIKNEDFALFQIILVVFEGKEEMRKEELQNKICKYESLRDYPVLYIF